MTSKEIINNLKKESNPQNAAGMSRFGIQGDKMLGISIPILRKMARDIKKADSDDHQLAQELWESGIHEARLLAGMIDNPKQVTEKQMDEWIKDFDSWDIVDQTCMNLFDKVNNAYDKATEWAKRDREFEKRAGFALMAVLAWHDKNPEAEQKLKQFFVLIKKEATDERNYVRKAVNWALRQIGKRNNNLKREAIKTAKEILKLDDKTAQWVAKDALRELQSK